MKTANSVLIEAIEARKVLKDYALQSLKTHFSVSSAHTITVVDYLLNKEWVTIDVINDILEDTLGVRWVDLRSGTLDQSLEIQNYSWIERYGAFPLKVDSDSCMLAVADPLDHAVIDSLSQKLRKRIHALWACPNAIRDAWNPRTVIPQAQESSLDYVQHLLEEAVKYRASDIHLEPLGDSFRFRFRIDGQLHTISQLSEVLRLSIVSHIKLMAQMDIAEKRLPQDGRVQLEVAQKKMDIRVASAPTVHGEALVLRLLDSEDVCFSLDHLGLFEKDQMQLKEWAQASGGIVLVTGPTGSGKTTTLYSLITQMDVRQQKIITVEDPVEYQLAGVNQVAVNSKIGMTFEGALRSILRQAPDTILIGEIRDAETAAIAVNAAITGHRVFSTLHTQDAVGAVTRLIDMGVKPFLLAQALRGVLAQRLVRKICDQCSEAIDGEGPVFYRGRGCELCLNTGYKGRLGIFELFEVDAAVRDIIHQGGNRGDFKNILNDMRTMREDGLEKARLGWTSREEILASTSFL